MCLYVQFLSFPAECSATYERCCVLFNIGALQSQIAKSQNFDSDEGLKAAAKHFQVREYVSAPTVLVML